MNTMKYLSQISIALLLAIIPIAAFATSASAQMDNPQISVLNNPNSPPQVQPALTNGLYIKPFENTPVNGQIQLIEARTLEPDTPVVLVLKYPTGSTAVFATSTDSDGYAGIVFPVESNMPGYATVQGIITSENQISATPISATFMVAP